MRGRTRCCYSESGQGDSCSASTPLVSVKRSAALIVAAAATALAVAVAIEAVRLVVQIVVQSVETVQPSTALRGKGRTGVVLRGRTSIAVLTADTAALTTDLGVGSGGGGGVGSVRGSRRTNGAEVAAASVELNCRESKGKSSLV